MERLAILFEGSAYLKDHPAYPWTLEWLACKESNKFDVAIFNYDEFLNGGEIICPKARKRDTPTIFRGHPTSENNYKKLAHELLRLGYRLITNHFDAYGVDSFKRFRILPSDPYEPYTIPFVNAEANLGFNANGAFPPSIYIARDSDGYARDDKNELLAIGEKSGEESRAIVRRFQEKRGANLAGKVFFEQYVPIRTIERIPVIWRAFYFDNTCFSIAPLDDMLSRQEGVPRPPEELVNIFSRVSLNPFYACDFALIEGDSWKVIRAFDGQMTQVPWGKKPVYDFYVNLTKTIEESPHIPDWIWCITAQVCDENRIGENKKLVHGTRHFAPGTKVYLALPNCDERVDVIGIPRYTNHLIKLVMWVGKLEKFKCEKVYDPEIITGLTRGTRQWPFTNFTESVAGRGFWDDSDEARKIAKEAAERLNGFHASLEYF